MRVLLSTIGSRGDVQPLLALALELHAQGHQSRICAPPDFRDFVEKAGFGFVGVGPAVRHVGSTRSAAASAAASGFSPDAIRRLATDAIVDQFATLGEAAAGCDVIVASTALQ